jgi:hypothetical protein
MRSKLVDPLRVLEARAQARAVLLRCDAWETEEEAIAPLMEYARAAGLVEKYGADVVWTIIDKAFHPAAETA